MHVYIYEYKWPFDAVPLAAAAAELTYQFDEISVRDNADPCIYVYAYIYTG